MKSFKWAASATCFFLLASTSAFSQVTINASGSLTGDDPDGTFSAFGDGYGAGADTWNDWLFVGSPRETAFRDGLDQQDGAVYIYRKVAGAYVFQQKLTMPGSSGPASGFAVGDRFGGGIEAAGGWLFVGAANDQNFPGLVDPRQGIFDPDDAPFVFAGQVHIYQFNGSSWDFVQTLTSPVPGSFGSFGTRTQASHIALADNAKTALIGELNNFAGGLGEAHLFRRTNDDTWEFVGTIGAPDSDLTSFADEVVNIGGKKYLIGGTRFSDDVTEVQGSVYVYKLKGKKDPSGATLLQTINGPIYDPALCDNGFGNSGIDANNGVIAIADPCYSGVAGAFAGRVSIYRSAGGMAPLSFEATIEGDEPNLFFGKNAFGSRHAIAVSESGGRILIGSPSSPGGVLDDGADVRVYAFDGAAWTEESNLTSLTPAVGDIRGFGDTVFFTDDETAFVRESNFLSPIVTGLKGQGLFYDLTP